MDDTAVIVAAGLAGVAWGAAADRIAARWPEHDELLVRPVDWRTPVVLAAGGISGAALVARFGGDPVGLAFLAPLLAALVLLFATDLDQRLLPDVLTLPIGAYALVGFALGVGPFVRTPADLGVAAVAGVALPGVLFLLSIPFGAGAFGLGDLKLLFGLALVVGLGRLVTTVIVGVLVAGISIVVLLIARRITLKSYVPYGPFLIAGALWAVLRPVAS